MATAEEQRVSGPDQALAAERRAEQIHAEIYGTGEGGEGNTGEPPAPGGEPEAGAASSGGENPGEGSDTDDLETLRQRYKVLKGKYDAETKQLREQVQAAQRAQQQAEERVQALQAEIEGLKQNEQDVSQWAQELEAKGYDPEFIDSLKQQNQQMGDKLAQVQAELAQLKAGGQGTGTPDEPAGEPSGDDDGKSERQREIDERVRQLAALVGGPEEFHRIDDNPEFSKWLDQQDPVDQQGRTRRDVMTEAFMNNRLSDAAAYFLAFAQGAGTARGFEGGPDRGELEAPGTGTGGGSEGGQDAGGKAWSRSAITQFYSDVARGRYSRERADQLEKEIDAAVQSGNVINA